MPRPKGSKNKPKTGVAKTTAKKNTKNYDAILTEKNAEKEQLNSDIAALTANLSSIKAELKAKKLALKATEKQIAKAAEKKAAEEAKAAAAARHAEVESVLDKLYAQGMTTEQIMAKLQ